MYSYNGSDNMEKTNPALVIRVQNEEEGAFHELFQQLYQQVYYCAYRICKSDDDAKEIAQQTFIQVHRSIKNLKDPKTFDVWLHRIVLSKCYNLFARRKDMIIDPTTSTILKNKKEHRDYLLPKKQSRRQSDIDLLNLLIDELPDKYRTLLILAYFQEHTMEEVSEILEMPVGTVKSRLSTARGLLRKKINEYEKTEGITLDFHEISPAVLSLAFTQAFSGCKITIPKNVFLPKSWMKSFSLPQALYTGVAIALSGVLTVGGYGLLHRNDASIPMERHLNYIEHEVIYEPVTLDNVVYATPQEAYYSLLVFAHCEVEMKDMSKAELYHIKPLYDALKASKSSYYRQLQKCGWEDAYLKLL